MISGNDPLDQSFWTHFFAYAGFVQDLLESIQGEGTADPLRDQMGKMFRLDEYPYPQVKQIGNPI